MTINWFGRLFLANLFTMSALFVQANSIVAAPVGENMERNDGILYVAGGGADTGGGNQIGAKPVSKEQVSELLNKAKMPAKFVVRRLELILTEFQGAKNLRAANPFKDLATKLFAGPNTFEEAISIAEFDQKQTGPCLDKLGQPFDASFLQAPVICFSLERLSSKLNSESVEPEILSLVLHEVSHMLGATEVEARFIQQQVKNILPLRPISSMQLQYNSYVDLVENKIETVRRILAGLQENQNLETCAEISAFLPTTLELWQANMKGASNTDKSGITFSAIDEIIFINGIMLKTLNAVGYCVSSYPVFKQIAAIFGDRKEIPLQELESKLYDRAEDTHTYLPSPNWIVRKQRVGDSEVLKKELQEILDALVRIKSKI